jgi:hypothetical protein
MVLEAQAALGDMLKAIPKKYDLGSRGRANAAGAWRKKLSSPPQFPGSIL